MSLLDKLSSLEDSAVSFLRQRAVVRLLGAAVVAAEVARRLYPSVSWIGNATEALVYAVAVLGVASPGLSRPQV